MANSVAGDMARSWLYHPLFPKDWKRRSLYSLAGWVNGLAFRNVQFSHSGEPVIKIAEIKAGISGQTKFTQQSFDESVRVRPGDMLFSWSGQPETSIDVHWWNGPTGWLNQHIFRVTPTGCIDRSFFYFLLRYLKPNFVAIASNKQTTGLGHVTKRDLERIEVAYPGVLEQQAIAAVLGALDDKIELNRRMNGTLEEMARAIFKSWFVDFDPVRAKAAGSPPPGLAPHIAALFPDSFTDSPLGPIPAGWKVGRLDDAVILQRGFDLPRSQRKAGPFPVMMASGPGDWHYEGKVSGPGVVTGRSGKLGDVFLLLKDFWPLNTTLWVKEFRASSPCHAYFLLQRAGFDSYNAGSAVPTLNRNHIHNLPAVIPPKKLVDTFERIGMNFFGLREANLAESTTLAALRDALLPKLISGELRIPDAERIVGLNT